MGATEDNISDKGNKYELDLLKVLINSINDIYCVKDGEGRWLYANEEYLRLFELEGLDYKGKKESELAAYSDFYSDVFLTCELTDEQAWKKVEISRENEKIPLSKGGYRVFDVIKVPIFNDDGSRKNLFVIGRDITDLTKERNYITSITEVIPDPFFILDKDGYIIEFHNYGLRSGLFNVSDLIGKNIRSLLDKSIFNKFFEAFKQVSDNGGVHSIEFELKSVDGSEFYNAQVVRFEADKFLATIHDITKVVNAQYELEQFKETHLEILESLNDAVYILNKNNYFLYVNKAAEELYGYESGELIGKTPAFLSPEGMNDLDEIVDLLRKSYNGEPQFFEFYGLAKDGRVFPKEVSSSLVMYYGEKAVISVARDISLQKQAESELMQARDKALESDRLKTSFLAILTHELRTPLNAIIGFSEILSIEAKDEFTSHYSKIIYDKGLDLLNIINDTLQMALIDAGEVELRREAFMYSDFLDELNVVVETLDISDSVELKAVDIDNEVSIVSDKTKLNQIMLNLIRNAIKFTDEGIISYGIRMLDKKDLYFFVEDAGTGISEEALGFIFNAFRQVEETISRSHGGLGLGLTISKELVSLLGGELKVKSEINKGSLFYFQIPGVVISY